MVMLTSPEAASLLLASVTPPGGSATPVNGNGFGFGFGLGGLDASCFGSTGTIISRTVVPSPACQHSCSLAPRNVGFCRAMSPAREPGTICSSISTPSIGTLRRTVKVEVGQTSLEISLTPNYT